MCLELWELSAPSGYACSKTWSFHIMSNKYSVFWIVIVQEERVNRPNFVSKTRKCSQRDVEVANSLHCCVSYRRPAQSFRGSCINPLQTQTRDASLVRATKSPFSRRKKRISRTVCKNLAR